MNITISITYQGRNGNYRVQMDSNVDDATVRRVCEEAVRNGEVPGLKATHVPQNAFANFVVDRITPRGRGEKRFVLRPRVPFGG